MSVFKSLAIEATLMRHNRAVLVALICVLTLSGLAVIGGLMEFERQLNTIEKLKAADKLDRNSVLSEQTDWGGAAYYSFHLTYDQPEPFAFASMGQRDTHPWKHRIRMLALEGQIYERDINNPVIALIGRFDFAFFAAFVLPFIIIVITHDLRTNERRNGRLHLLLVTAGSESRLWISRTLVLSFSIYICVATPLVIGCMINAVPATIILSAIFYLALYVLFWTLVCYWVASWHKSSTFMLASLMGLWLVLTIIIPTGSRIGIDKMLPIPSGAEILMTQREAVNGAWDITKEQTMDVFLERYPEWKDDATISRPFEWKWYFAFQEVGDIKTEELSKAYRTGRLERDQMAGYFSFLAPPAWFERKFQKLAKTDTVSNLKYEQSVRDYHSNLRQFYYPKLFEEQTFDEEQLAKLPIF